MRHMQHTCEAKLVGGLVDPFPRRLDVVPELPRLVAGKVAVRKGLELVLASVRRDHRDALERAVVAGTEKHPLVLKFRLCKARRQHCNASFPKRVVAPDLRGHGMRERIHVSHLS
jgi:hypothetical protein